MKTMCPVCQVPQQDDLPFASDHLLDPSDWTGSALIGRCIEYSHIHPLPLVRFEGPSFR